MNAEEMKNEYYALYSTMANSQNPANMKLFGKVMTEMFMWYADNKPEIASEWLDKLESIKWHNYLTPKEAEKIVAGMNPKAPWNREVWKQAMNQLNLPTEEEPYYNTCSLWVVMNQVYTDHAQTIADNIIKKPLTEIPVEQIVPAIRALAIDLLKDKDHVYNVRKYFGV